MQPESAITGKNRDYSLLISITRQISVILIVIWNTWGKKFGGTWSMNLIDLQWASWFPDLPRTWYLQKWLGFEIGATNHKCSYWKGSGLEFGIAQLRRYQRPKQHAIDILLFHELVFFFDLLLSFYLGGTPYPTISNHELLGALKSRYRMEKPELCSDEM